MIEVNAENKAERQRELIFLAWHIEAFARQKRLPKLESILRGTSKKKRNKKQFGKDELIKIAKAKGLKGPW